MAFWSILKSLTSHRRAHYFQGERQNTIHHKSVNLAYKMNLIFLKSAVALLLYFIRSMIIRENWKGDFYFMRNTQKKFAKDAYYNSLMLGIQSPEGILKIHFAHTPAHTYTHRSTPTRPSHTHGHLCTPMMCHM